MAWKGLDGIAADEHSASHSSSGSMCMCSGSGPSPWLTVCRLLRQSPARRISSGSQIPLHPFLPVSVGVSLCFFCSVQS